ncbi:nucleotidyltransferase domain-containing protein [Streptomyces sp. RO-S4]|uniref:nucleotidyltransferase domain-containing protein n=1 Tax=unclassified Streptomyces TaxID=2593676 RepID=UPI001E5B5D7D|nr:MULTISPECIES: nucleotidyltransferase domain-containing protein [unclassified Streptomyces]MCO4695372.1 nucleotidyltransferase domain-containing protein [Streptomyces sp. RO-S4]MDU0304778.1 nucleotidyltransferase domain-containing protein [Streptomyces sp. PAL114]
MSVHSARRSSLDDRIARLRELAHADTRLEGVLLYGSWTVGEADAHSDIEAYLYVQDDHLADFDGPAFLAQLAPLQLAYTNMYGILAVVFDDLMRGEFHLTAAGPGIDEVPTWQGMVHLPRPDDAVLLDRTGRLTRAARQLAAFQPPEPVTTAQQLTDELTNWTLMLAHVLARGEIARAHALLHGVVAPQQLQLCRLLRGSTAHWLTPSRALEQDLPEADRQRYVTTTAVVRDGDVRTAARNSWRWSRDLASEAADRWGIRLPHELHDRITDHLNAPR